MSSVIRASACIRHIPGLYRQLSNVGPVYFHNVPHGTLGVPCSTKFRHLTCPPTRYMQRYGAFQQIIRAQNTLRSPPMQPRSDDFGVVLKNLDSMVRRTGRITKNQLLAVFDEVAKLRLATPNQSLLLIRSCGSLLPEMQPTERTELVHSFWEKMKSFGTKYDASHYNALLKVYLQNEHSFEPTEFLAKMEHENVEPNRVTYHRLISAYCLKGDIAGATQILEFMKAKDLPVTEGVFNSLITGHARANDLESAKNILNVMRNVGLEPSADTFTTLMAAYAENGEVSEIEKIIEEAESQQVILGGRHYISLAYSVAASGNMEYLSKVLKRVDLGSGYIPDTINLCLSLLVRGLHEAAFETVKLFLRDQEGQDLAAEKRENYNHGNFFLDHGVSTSMDFEQLSTYMDKMIELGLHSSPHTLVLRSAIRKGNFDYAQKVIRRMKELGLPLRAHYFWPMLVATKDEDAVKRLLGLMIEMEVPITVDTYMTYILPAMNRDSEKILATVQELGGSVEQDLISALCRYELSQGQLSGVVDLLNRFPDLVEVSFFKQSLAKTFCRSKDVDAFVTILKHMNATANSPPDFIGSLLYNIVESITPEEMTYMKPLLQILFTRMAEEQIYTSAIRCRGIRNLLTRHRAGLRDYVVKIVHPSEVEQTTSDNLDLFPTGEVDVADLENVIKESKEQGRDYKVPLKTLILQKCADSDYDRVMELKKDFDEAGYPMTGLFYASMLIMCCNLNRASEALLLYRQLRENDPTFILDLFKYRALIVTLVKNNQMEDVAPILEDMMKLDYGRERLERAAVQLLDDLAKEGDPEKVKLVFDSLLDKKLARVSHSMVGSLVKSYLVKDDAVGALQCMIDCQSKYKMTPYLHDLLVKLVEQGTTENLQKAMDFASEQYGDINMLYDLIFAFLTTGKVSEAMKVIETPGMVARERRLQWYADRCIEKSDEEALKNLVTVTRDLYGCDRDEMYFYMIRYYAKAQDPDQCLQVWTNMQDEGVLPKDRTMRYLADVLTTHNKSVPFEVPAKEETSGYLQTEESSSFTRRTRDIVRRGDHPIIVLAKEGKFAEAERQLEHSQEEGQEVPLGVYRFLMWSHLKQDNLEDAIRYKDKCLEFESFKLTKDYFNRLQVGYIKRGDYENAFKVFHETLTEGMVPLPSGARMLARHYVTTGNVEKMLELKELYESKADVDFPFAKEILAAYVERDDITTALSFIKNQLQLHPDRSRLLGFRSFYSRLLQKNKIDRQVTDLAEQQLNNDVDGPALGLLFAYLDNDRVEEAQELVEKCPVLKERASAVIGYVIESSRHQSNNVSRQKIENVLRMTEGQSYMDREAVYFYLLKACDLMEDWSGGLNVKERMEAEGINLNDFHLKRLGLLLERNNQEVPFTMPPESLEYYREKLELLKKDQLQEIA